MDFTLKLYAKFILKFKDAGFSFQTFNQFIDEPLPKVIILRHDVDRLPKNSLKTAKIEFQSGIKSSYYFRIGKESFNSSIIKQIAEMGHEIGYHYETMDTCKGIIDNAYKEFCINLFALRKFVTIETICMHGSPLSEYDNRDIWLKYNYKNLGIKGEPYFDIDFSKVLYITDTGRRWNGNKTNIRDKEKKQDKPLLSDYHKFHSTFEILGKINNNQLPNQIMINTHPQRWTNNYGLWTRELIMQNIKNQIKKTIIH